MSRQVIVGGNPSSPSQTVTRYTSIVGNARSLWEVADTFSRQICPAHVNLHTFRVALTVAPGVGKSWTFTIRKSLTATPLTVTISGTDTAGVDTGHAVGMAANQFIDMTCVPSGTPAATVVRWSVSSDSVSPGETILPANTPQINDQATSYYALVGSMLRSATEFEREIVFPTAGTLKTLYAVSSAPPGVGDSFIYTIRHNGGDTGITCTIAGTSQSASDLTHSQAVAAGDTA